METAEQLRARIGAMQDLQSVVRTMKGLAAVNIRQYERAARSIQRYVETIDSGLQILLRRRPADATLRTGRPPAVVALLLGSDQGMVGQFNARIFRYALGRLKDRGPHDAQVLLVAGRRLASAVEAGGRKVSAVFALPASAEAIAPRLSEVVVEIERLRAQRPDAGVVVFHNRWLSGSSYEPSLDVILPMDEHRLRRLEEAVWPTRMLPMQQGQWGELLSGVVRQHMYASLFEAFASSLAAENASRMISMQAAERNIEERLDDLMGLFRRRRQGQITEELLDVISGFEALAGHEGETP